MSLGFTINPYNPCVTNKIIDGHKLVCWHVDDLLNGHSIPEIVTWFLTWIAKCYNTPDKNHNPTLGSYHDYLGIVDLVKAYDTVNHNLLLDILEKYGAPPRFVLAIERICQDLVVVLKIEKEVVELSQSVGVQQGDNMAPVLFLLLMSAFAETLEAEWKNAGIGVCTLQSFVGQKLATGEGKLQGHLPKEYLARTLTAVKILQCLYVDDGAFIFASRVNMMQGLTLVYQHFGRLGLEMNIGRGETPSITECVFFPPLAFLTHTCLPCLTLKAIMRSTMHSDMMKMHSPTRSAIPKGKSDRTKKKRRNCMMD